MVVPFSHGAQQADQPQSRNGFVIGLGTWLLKPHIVASASLWCRKQSDPRAQRNKTQKKLSIVLLTASLSFSNNNQFSNSLIPTGYPTIQFNSDPNYVELVPTHKLREFVAQSNKNAPTSHASHKWDPQATHTCPADYAFGNSHYCPFPRFNNSLEQLIELRKALYLPLQFYYKDTTQKQPNGRDAWGKGWGVGWGVHRELLCPPWVRHPPSTWMCLFTTLEDPQTSLFQRFY